MMTIGIGSIAGFVKALDRVEERQSTRFDADRAFSGYFAPKPAGLLLSAICAGPSVCDLVASRANSNSRLSTITLVNVDVPSVILFEILSLTVDMRQGQCVAWNTGCRGEIEAVCWRGSLSLIKGMREDLISPEPTDLTMHPVTQKPRCQSMSIDQRIQREAVEIDCTLWRQVKTYADRLLVDASDTSRLIGAGSGSVIEVD